VKFQIRGGDGGETGLLSGGRVSKADPRVEAYGAVDEAIAFSGMAHAECLALPEGPDRLFLLQSIEIVQDGLMRLCADLASGGTCQVGVDDGHVAALQARIDLVASMLPALNSFLVPGGSRAEASLHVARTVVRRAERGIVALGDSFGPIGARLLFLNRVSDLLFSLSRLALRADAISERPWIP
jgi:cob(I)alamin adenosyltransferase